MKKLWISYFFILFIYSICFGQDQFEIAEEYFNQQNYEKALDIYQDLARKQQNLKVIHKNYLKTLELTNNYKLAHKHLQKIIKNYPQEVRYKIDLASIYHLEGRQDECNKLCKQIVREYGQYHDSEVRHVAEYFIYKQFYDHATALYLEARKRSGSPILFATELAMLYYRINNKTGMVDEYVNLLAINPSFYNEVVNVLQNVFQKVEDLEQLETLLYERIQQYPSKVSYGKLLIWVNIQQKNFYGAFIQARALDKKKLIPFDFILELGEIALHNNDYKNAIKIFNYLNENHKDNKFHIKSKHYLIKAREEMVKHTYPIDTSEIKKLINDYQFMYEKIGIQSITLEGMRNQALLYAFYLNDYQTASQKLGEIVTTRHATRDLVAQSKLDHGDIFILMDQPWESTLLYSQVEKSHKKEKLGHLAKLKNAKLSYYKGDFNLATQHLDILKLATTREIANDAMALSLLIKDNLALDSTSFALMHYAKIELMLFQHKLEQALDEFDTMLGLYPNHSLTDEILYHQAEIYLGLGNVNASIRKLEQLVKTYGDDILGDDATYMLGKIYEEHVKDKAKAMEIYKNFLTQHAGSLYATEVRTRFRTLRGDFEEKP